MADLSLQQADINDPEEFKRVYQAMVLAARASHIKPASKKYLRNEFTEKRSEPYFIMNGPTLLGAAIISPAGASPYLYDFALYKKNQGKGYGRPALDVVLKHLAASGKPVELDVGYDNHKAQHLYEQAGFKKEHEWKSTGNWHMKKDAAAISFPEEEIPTISKQDRIITTRVSDDYDKYRKGDSVETPWGVDYTVNNRLDLKDLKDHPYYDELTEEQKELLRQYKRIAVLELLRKMKYNVYPGRTPWLKEAAMAPEERKLRSLAKPYYVEHGNNSWDHIQQVYTNADAMTRQIYGRPLTLSEKAAIFFHDSAVLSKGRKNHGQNARDLAIPILLSTGYFDQKQLDDIGQAILEHDTLDNKGGPFTSTTGEVLASADTEPPDIPWMLNKIYGWHIKNTPNKAAWKQGIYDSVKEYFGPDVNALQPPLYNKFHKDRRRRMKEQLNSYSADELWDIVTKYRKKHRIGEDEVRYPDTTLLKAASYLYHASPKALKLLAGITTKHGETGYVFVSPSKAHASLFALDRQAIVDAIEKQLDKNHIKINNISYGQWKNAPSDQALDTADVYVDTDDKFDPFSGEQEGYLYSIDTKPYMDKIKKWKHDNGDRELLIEGDVVPDKVEKLKLRYNVLPGKAP